MILTDNNRLLVDFDKDTRNFIYAAGLDNDANLDVGGLYTAEQARMAFHLLVRDLKKTGIWDRCKIISPYKGGTENIVKLNLKGNEFEQTLNQVLVNPFGIAFQGNNLSFADLNIDLSTEVVNPNDLHVSLFVNKKSTAGIGVDFGLDIEVVNTSGSNRYLISSNYTNDRSFFGIGNDVGLIFELPFEGFSVMNRINSSNFKVLINDKLTSNSNFQNATIFPSYPPILGGVRYSNGIDNPSNAEIGFFTLGYSLTTLQMYQLKHLVSNFNNNLKNNLKTNIYFGDSITEGYIDSFNKDLVNRWTTKLSTSLRVIEDNRGVGGTTMQNTAPTNVYAGPNMRDRASTDIPTYNSNIHKHLFISYGVNDCYMHVNYTPTIFGVQLGEVIDIALSKGWSLSNIKVLTPFYIEFYGSGDITKIENIRDEVISVCSSKGCQYINVYDNMTNSDLSVDLVHPSIIGHNTISEYIKSQL